MKNHSIKQAFQSSVPIIVSYVVLGAGYGLLAVKQGIPIWATLLMSIIIFGGSMQFVMIDLILSSASFFTVAITTLMIHARNLFYSLSMLLRYQNMKFPLKPISIFTCSDETYSIVCQDELPEGVDQDVYRFAVSLIGYTWWFLGTVLGVVLGEVLSFDTAGIEFSMTALFVSVFVEQWISHKNHIPALIGVGVSFICLILVGPSGFLIPTMVFIIVLLRIFRKKVEEQL